MKTTGRIERRLRENRKKGKKSLIAYVNAGDPDLLTTIRIIESLETHGIDVVELGVPFPNSCTDGPVILRSHQRALKNGTTLKDVLDVIKAIRKGSRLPIVLMAEFGHTVAPLGLQSFLANCREAEVDGTLLHCLPPYLGRDYCAGAKRCGVETILSVYPNTKKAKRKTVYGNAQGFLYLVSTYGKTGRQAPFTAATIAYFKKVKQETGIPLAVGFGVNGPAEMKIVYGAGMDAAIIGSALLAVIERAGPLDPEKSQEFLDFIREVRHERDKWQSGSVVALGEVDCPQ